jgi:hypothetical protein
MREIKFMPRAWYQHDLGMCGGKKCYIKRVAIHDARDFRSQGEEVEAYHCKLCGHYHVGHVMLANTNRQKALDKKIIQVYTDAGGQDEIQTLD